MRTIMTSQSTTSLCMLLCLPLLLAGAASAHHSNAAYDNDHLATFTGTVKQVNWTNPHITFLVERDANPGEQGAATWVLEVSSPGVLTRSGWTKRSLQPGDHASFRYAPLRNGTPSGYLQEVTLANGQKLTYSLTPPDQPGK
jgi:hypothetical protein